MDDDVELDLYGDLADFDLGEKLRETNQQVTDLEERLNKSLETIQRLEAQNKGLHKETQILNKNISSLMTTAKSELQRKEKEIQNLRREKEDICFRRSKVLTKHQVKDSQTISVQTDLCFSGNDCVEIQRTGQFNVKFSINSSTQKENPDRDRTSNLDHHTDTLHRTSSQYDRDGRSYRERTHHVSAYDRRKSVDCRPNRRDSDREGITDNRSKERGYKRLRETEIDDRNIKRLRYDSSNERSKRNYEHSDSSRNHRVSKRGSPGSSHSNSSNKTSESKSSQNNRQKKTSSKEESKYSSSKPDGEMIKSGRLEREQNDLKQDVGKKIEPQAIDASIKTKLPSSKSIDTNSQVKKSSVKESFSQPEIVKSVDTNEPPNVSHQLQIATVGSNELPKEPAKNIDSPEKSNLDLGKKPELHSHSPDSTTKTDDSTTLNSANRLPSLLTLPTKVPSIKISLHQLPQDINLLKSRLNSLHNPDKLEPLPSAFDLFKTNKTTLAVDSSQLQKNPNTKTDTITSENSEKSTPTLPEYSDLSSTTKRGQSPKKDNQDQNNQPKTTDDVPIKCDPKPIVLRRKTMAVEPKSNLISKKEQSKPNEIDNMSVEYQKSKCNKPTIKKNIKYENVDIPLKPTKKAVTRSASKCKKETKEKSTHDSQSKNISDMPNQSSKPPSSKSGLSKNCPNFPNKSKSEDSKISIRKAAVVSKSSVATKTDTATISSIILTSSKKINSQTNNSIENKLAKLVGTESSDSEHSTHRKTISNLDRRSNSSTNSSTTTTPSKPADTINICETPIASLVEHIFSNNEDDCQNDANVSDASSTSLRIAGESVEQIDLYLTRRRKRRSNGKCGLTQRLELNSSTQSKSMDLIDNHTSVSMDVDIELTQKSVQDPHGEATSIIALFDALQTPRKTSSQFELVEDTGSLFAGIHCQQENAKVTPKRQQIDPNENKQEKALEIETTKMATAEISSTSNDPIHNISNPIAISIESKADTTVADKSDELKVIQVQSDKSSIQLVSNTEPVANKPSTSDGKLLVDQSLCVPSHQPPSTMDNSFLNLIPTSKTNHEEHSQQNHYEDYLNNVKINDLSTLSDLFEPADLSNRRKTDSNVEQNSDHDQVLSMESLNTLNEPSSTEIAEVSDTDRKESPDTLPTESNQTNVETSNTTSTEISPPNNNSQPIASPISSSISQPEIIDNPIQTPTDITQTPTIDPSTTDANANNSALLTSNVSPSDTTSNTHNTSGHTTTKTTARLSYYVEENTTNNEVTMFITRKKKRKQKP